LMARERPGVSLGELHLEAMKLLVAALEKRKFAAGVRQPPRQRGGDSGPPERDSEPRQRGVDSEPPERDSEPRQRRIDSEPRQRGAGTVDAAGRSPASPSSQRRSRHIPAALRREVYERDAGRCSYLDARGERCGETRYLELLHLQPFARGGQHRAANLALRCKAHNRLAAERDFGPELIAERSDGARHESLARQKLHDSGFA
ncbi:MAG TPA: hypothetical protein VHB79_05945, partial [Polyangiaceae bacterium]|nr:hypothetical protein [Polyangiaceae bacterium]